MRPYMPERSSPFWRIYRYGRLLIGRGFDMAAFWIATVYSIWTFAVPLDVQRKAMIAVHVDPSQRLVIFGFGLAAFFLYAGFRAWDEEHAIVERLSESTTAIELRALRTELESVRSREWPRLTIIQKNALAGRLRSIGSYTIWIIRPNDFNCVGLAKDFDEAFRQAGWNVPHDEPYSPGEEKLGITIQTLMNVAPALQAAIVETTSLPARIYEIREIERRSWNADHVVLSVGLKS
jgi:hypothetical protein